MSDQIEEQKAQKALAELPITLRGFYKAHYQIIGSRPPGSFVGLVCKCCEYWLEFGHKDDCPVKKISTQE